MIFNVFTRVSACNCRNESPNCSNAVMSVSPPYVAPRPPPLATPARRSMAGSGAGVLALLSLLAPALSAQHALYTTTLEKSECHWCCSTSQCAYRIAARSASLRHARCHAWFLSPDLSRITYDSRYLYCGVRRRRRGVGRGAGAHF